MNYFIYTSQRYWLCTIDRFTLGNLTFKRRTNLAVSHLKTFQRNPNSIGVKETLHYLQTEAKMLQSVTLHKVTIPVESRFNEPLFNEVLDITNDTLRPGQNYSKMYGIEPRYNEPRYNEHNPEAQT